MADIESIKRRLASRRKDPPATGLSSGSVLINLACSGDPDYAYRTGGYYFYVGDSASGKTLLTWYALAEAAHREGTALAPQAFLYMRWWFALGWPAFLAFLAIFHLMVNKGF